MVKVLKNNQLVDFGQEQIPYDISKTKDETFNTCKIVVESDEKEPLEPSTFVNLDDEYWYVNGDKCVYRANNKSTHHINLIDITQVLNDRFVEDCKFAQNRYTYAKGIDRLLKLSNSTDIRVEYDYRFESAIDYTPTTYTKAEDEDEVNFPIYTITNMKEDDIFQISGEYQMNDGGEIVTKPFSIKVEYNTSNGVFTYMTTEETIHIIEFFWYNNVIGLTMKKYKSLHWGGPDFNPIYVKITSISLFSSNRKEIMPTFQFEDTNLYNALESVCLALGVKPRLKYDNGLVLHFVPIGANNVIHKFSEIQDIEITKEYSREANAKNILSNCKNISGDEYVWFPSNNFGKALLPDDGGLQIQAYDKAVFKFNSNVRDIKKIRIFPLVEIYHEQVKIFSGYSDGNFFENVVGSFVNNGLSRSKAIKYVSQMMSNFSEGEGIYVDVEEGKGQGVFYGQMYVHQDVGFEISATYNTAALREKKKYDLLTHKHVFDTFRLDEKEKSLYWEQNSDYIKGFNGTVFTSFTIFSISEGDEIQALAYFNKDQVRLSAYYLPQTDIRLVTENENNFDITKQFNQSGKMIDYYHTKKELQNYIDAMGSKDVIVTALYKNKNDIYNVGDVIYDDENDKKYIITNCSIKVLGGNMYDVIYQLNENYIRRSEYISADSDIRDYNIPITNLVTRQKTYKDKLVFSYKQDVYNSRLPVYAAMNVFLPSGLYYINGAMDKPVNLSSTYDIAILKCKYADHRETAFTIPTTIISSKKGNSKSININIPDNYIIGWNYFVSYNLQNTFEPFFKGWGLLYTSGKYYTPIRYADLKGEIKEIELLLVKSSKIEKYDYEVGTYTSDAPYLSSLYLIMPIGNLTTEDGETRDFYEISNKYVEDVIRLDNTEILKDRYETLSFTEEIEYVGANDIELGSALTQEGNNELFYNRIEDNRLLRLYDKTKYPYIKDGIKFNDDYYIEIILDEHNVIMDATGKITINLGQQVDLSKYNVVIINSDKELIMALNNYSDETKQHIKLYLNGYKY